MSEFYQKSVILEQSYDISKDYEILWSYLQNGHWIVCFVDYDKTCRDVCRARKDDLGYVSLGSRGMGYSFYYNSKQKADFLEVCENLDLSFIMPDEK